MLLLDKELLLLNFRRERMSLFKLVDIKKLCPEVPQFIIRYVNFIVRFANRCTETKRATKKVSLCSSHK